MCGVAAMLPTSSAACATRVAPPGPGRARVADRLVFRVEDLETAIARGVDMGVAVEDRHERCRAVRVSDPKGTPVFLFR
ncbi:MAG: hypothetical protein JO284_09450 [Planctomycetaceae bacterium]|nr:hypothetical protein [Planctomycetaceae bacterium]MBV8230160.1 hypothetical protein [Planctomycetaceae bacterium]